MQEKKKPMPKHAASFSVSLISGAVGLINSYAEGSKTLTQVSYALALVSFLYGMHDLYKEKRLNKIIQPIHKGLSFFLEHVSPGTPKENHHSTHAASLN